MKIGIKRSAMLAFLLTLVVSLELAKPLNRPH